MRREMSQWRSSSQKKRLHNAKDRILLGGVVQMKKADPKWVTDKHGGMCEYQDLPVMQKCLALSAIMHYIYLLKKESTISAT